MPLYEYQCTACGRRTEALQRLSDPPLAECPECGGEVKKLLSAPAFQFKGSGWYVTDYARKGKPEAKAGGGKSDTSDQGDTGDKGDKGDKADKADKAGGEKPSAGGGDKSSAADGGAAKSEKKIAPAGGSSSD